jgi:septum site-determining protein MinC
MKNSVIIKSNKYGISVLLDKDLPFEELKADVARKFQESAKFFGEAQMAVSFEERDLSDEEQKELIDLSTENTKMKILCIVDMDEEKEEIFRQLTDRRLGELSAQSGKFYKGTLRSGQVLESETSIVILGDVNPGAKVISKGNVIVLGALKGTIFAGAAGNDSSFVVALEMYPMQIRIADVIARSSDDKKKRKTSKVSKEAKIAFIDDGYIYIEPLSRDIIKYVN